MIRYEPTFRPRAWARGLDELGRGAVGPVCELADMLSTFAARSPDALLRFQRACASVNLSLADGLATALTMPPQSVDASAAVLEGVSELSVLTSEQLFAASRDALAGDRTARLWRDRNATYDDFVGAIQSATRELEQGYDPRQPW